MYPLLSDQLTKKDVNKSDAILIARFCETRPNNIISINS